MLKILNHYCSNCLRTQRFLDLGYRLVCECCSKYLERVAPEGDQQEKKKAVVVQTVEDRRQQEAM